MDRFVFSLRISVKSIFVPITLFANLFDKDINR